jgi:DNA replication protein DnaC
MNTLKMMQDNRESERLMLEHMHIYVDEYCSAEDNPGIHINTYQKMKSLLTDEVYCPKCKLETRNTKVSIDETEASSQWKDKEKKKYLKRYSIYGGRSFLDKGFKGFDAKSKQELEACDKAKAISIDIASGKVTNVLLTGPAGTGKSHLAHAIVFNINEMSASYKKQLSCLFIDFTSVMELIIASYSNTATDKKTADWYIDLMKNADVLVLDDLGTDVGKADTTKQASDHTYKTLFKVLNARDGTKSTIISTNLTYDQLKKVYDERVSSRLSMNLKILDFSEINDKRPGFGF